MKKILSLILAGSMLFSFAVTSIAVGDTNIDGGGGDLGQGGKGNLWNVGDDGVRITVVNAKTQSTVKSPVDFTNTNQNSVQFHFGKKSKIQYKNGASLSLSQNKYIFNIPTNSIPPIISPSGASNIAKVKEYFSKKPVLIEIAKNVGIEYETFISGDYKLLLEPIAYFKYNGVHYAATAHEASLLDQLKDGDLSNKIGQLTRKNLPLSMFLETADLGFPKWTGTTSGIVSNRDIQTSLGIGIVKFKDEPPTPGGGDIEAPTYKYHTDIDVYTSFYIKDKSGKGVTPDDGGKVSITIGSKTYTQKYVVPPNDSQLIYVRWHTPKTPQIIPIKISVTGGGYVDKTSTSAEITHLIENEPPDTKAEDLPPSSNWRIPKVPSQTETTKLTWGVWTPRWKEHWVKRRNGKDKDGKPKYKWVDEGWWEYDWNPSSLSLKTNLTISPDKFCPTSKSRGGTKWEIKSGYGIQIEAKASLVGGGEHTDAQNAIATFPEFEYATYNRLFAIQSRNVLTLKENKYAYNPSPVHFVPIWYPDNSRYEPQVVVLDVWTPAGMLSDYSSEYIYIDGDCYDDWTVGPVPNNQSIR